MDKKIIIKEIKPILNVVEVMSKSLVIVESPNKVKTISKILKGDYIVTSSVGHIRDLATKTAEKDEVKEKLTRQERKLKNFVNRIGIDPKDWHATYEVIPGKEKTVRELKSLAKECTHIYLATDLDREGESIAWHLKEVLGNKYQYSRVIFNEITAKAITKAFEHPTHLDMNKVNAQQTRRFLDRIVGFMLSPLLWKKVTRGLSAGRVQSVAVKMLVEKEREIRIFKPIEYWDITGKDKHEVEFALYSIDGKRLTNPNDKNPNYIATEQEVEKIKQEFACQNRAIIEDIKVKETSISPRAPFITSSLQQSASTYLGFTIKRTMATAQSLYELGYITYMRTDSTNLSTDAIDMVRNYINTNYAPEYLPNKANFYATKNSSAQEAHEAIRPTSLVINPDSIASLSDDQKKIYKLIRNQFIACQMTDSKHLSTSVLAKVKCADKECVFRTQVSVVKFLGWQILSTAANKDTKDISLYNIGDKVDLKISAKQNFTSPPARFNEASLVKELEKHGIGRPSTYVSIISTIQDRGYAELKGKQFHATKMAEIVSDLLGESFANFINYNFTADMEKNLDDISTGKLNWKKGLTEFYTNFSKAVEIAELDPTQGGMRSNSMLLTSIKCPTCKNGNRLGLKFLNTGFFLGCESYSNPKERCGTILDVQQLETVETQEVQYCPKCSSKLETYFEENNKLDICSNAPACDYINITPGKYELPKAEELPTIPCDKCDNTMHFKTGRFGNYMKCDTCDNTRRILANGEVAAPRKPSVEYPELPCKAKDAYFILRDSSKGWFMSPHNFPKVKETMPTYIDILQKYSERLPEVLSYLISAPAVDPDGNRTILRYSTKEKKQFLGSLKGIKATKWRADYVDGQWQDNVTEAKPKVTKTKVTKKTTKKSTTTKK